jgi:CheY-like chemotaxis protein
MHDGPSDTDRPFSILIAGLTRESREMYREFLIWAGWRVMLAATSTKATAMAAALQPDVVATSNRLEPLDGLQLCERLHRDPRTAHIPVVILTTATALLDLTRAKASGCATLLVQPTLPQGLLTEAKRLIARARRTKKRTGVTVKA